MPIEIASNKHVLIAGPTASGKSSLALRIAEEQGGVIVNADAMQVFDGWRIITARPDDNDLNRAIHALYGHMPFDKDYSVGDWLREVERLLKSDRLIIVGGTGLYLSALTEGLAEIPQTPEHMRKKANALSLAELIEGLDPEVRKTLDLNNRMRVQRAWEVQLHTKKSILQWQRETPRPLVPITEATAICLNAPKEWLSPRIEKRFDLMLAEGVLDEARAMLPKWKAQHASSKAIGAPELIAHLKGEISLDETRERVIIASRQYAKRQRTWFRKRMKEWINIDVSSTDLSTGLTFVA